MAATTKRRPASKANARPRKKPAPRKKASNDTMTWLKDRGPQFLGLFASLLAVRMLCLTQSKSQPRAF